MGTGTERRSIGPWHFALCVLIAAQWPCAASARDKTDIVEVKNGDRIHGEIVTLEYGKLKLKTDSFGTIYVQWPDVVAVESRHSFYVEVIGGRRYFGALTRGSDDDGGMTVTGGASIEHLLIADVTRIDQVEQGFWDRIDGSFSVGFNYAKSTEISVTSAQATGNYRSRLHVATLSTNMNITTDSDGQNNRLQLAYSHQYLRPKGRFWIGGASFERNDELGLDGRLQFAGGLGTYLRQTSFSEVGVYGGIALNQEWNQGGEDSQQTVEAILGSNWRIFQFSDPETSLNSTFVLYPSLSQWGRVRSSLNVSLRRELIEDLFLDLSLYHSYDNEPPSEDAAKDDYGIVTSLGYSF